MEMVPWLVMGGVVVAAAVEVCGCLGNTNIMFSPVSTPAPPPPKFPTNELVMTVEYLLIGKAPLGLSYDKVINTYWVTVKIGLNSLDQNKTCRNLV